MTEGTLKRMTPAPGETENLMDTPTTGDRNLLNSKNMKTDTTPLPEYREGLTFQDIGSILNIEVDDYVDITQGETLKLGGYSKKSSGDRENQHPEHNHGTQVPMEETLYHHLLAVALRRKV